VQNRCLALTLNAPTLGAAGEVLCAKSGLTPSDWCLLPYFGACAINGRFGVLEVLDDVAKATSSPGVAARTLACIADCLGKFAFGRGGLRSGPGRNAAFMPGMELLRAGEIAKGVARLAVERKNWLSSPDALIRAARHYESAAQILISHAVMTAQEFVHFAEPDPTKAIRKDQWIMAEAAARIDCAGGWSDTPPVTYEHGGAVCNASILIDGERPIGAKARRIPQNELVLVMGEQRIVVRDYASLGTYGDMHARTPTQFIACRSSYRRNARALYSRHVLLACACVC
jgi:fucokinase